MKIDKKFDKRYSHFNLIQMGNTKSKNNNNKPNMNINNTTKYIKQVSSERESDSESESTSDEYYSDEYYSSDETTTTDSNNISEDETTSNSNTISEGELCTICFVNAINCELIPCKHKMFCRKCINKWDKTVDKKVEQMLNDIIDKEMEIKDLPNRCCPYCYKFTTDVYTIEKDHA